MNDLHARAPVNRTAAAVVGKGINFVPSIHAPRNDSPAPIPTRAPTAGERKASGFVNLAGVRFGRMTVIGMARDSKGWVVRCSCGTYTTRLSKSIKNPNNVQDRCNECRHLAFLKREEHWRRTGRDKDINEF